MSQELQQRGLEMRRKVLGATQVEQTMANTDRYTQPLQDLVNQSCWGAVWARPELEPRIRCMLTLAMLTALDRPTHLKTHMRAALRNGVTREEIVEIVLHASVYCGMPAAVDASVTMREVFAESGRTA